MKIRRVEVQKNDYLVRFTDGNIIFVGRTVLKRMLKKSEDQEEKKIIEAALNKY